MSIPVFEPFPKVPRLLRDIVVTEKIDGTNASVYIPEDPDEPILAGSRTRWLIDDGSKGWDNFGFGRWVYSNAEDLREELGPGHHFGEWWGQGIQRGYDLDHKRFSLFNTTRWANADLDLCHVVPVLYEGAFSIDVNLLSDGSVAAPGFKEPEGIMVYHTAGGQYFKYTYDGDGHKGNK